MIDLMVGEYVRCELNGNKTCDRFIGACYLGSRDVGEALIEAILALDCPRFSDNRYKAVDHAPWNLSVTVVPTPTPLSISKRPPCNSIRLFAGAVTDVERHHAYGFATSENDGALCNNDSASETMRSIAAAAGSILVISPTFSPTITP